MHTFSKLYNLISFPYLFIDLKVSIADGRYFGNVEVTRYGVTGSVCDVGWDDKDAEVLCKELGFTVSFFHTLLISYLFSSSKLFPVYTRAL